MEERPRHCLEEGEEEVPGARPLGVEVAEAEDLRGHHSRAWAEAEEDHQAHQNQASAAEAVVQTDRSTASAEAEGGPGYRPQALAGEGRWGGRCWRGEQGCSGSSLCQQRRAVWEEPWCRTR